MVLIGIVLSTLSTGRSGMTTCHRVRPMLLPFVDCMAVAALLLVPASRAVGSEAADRERTEALKTRVEVAFKSSMVCNAGRCYRRRGPYYIEEYTDVRAQYDDASKPKEFAIL